MERSIFLTEDVSHSIIIPSRKITYHSTFGAIQESTHVFIEAGLRFWLNGSSNKTSIDILEIGFGTGLNALLSFIEIEKKQRPIYYESLETAPLESNIIHQLNYCTQLNRSDLFNSFSMLHNSTWNEPVAISTHFSLCKRNVSLLNYSSVGFFNIIYFDAFAPEHQPELWTKEIFSALFNILEPGGTLLTYCSKVVVRRAMEEAGFIVEKIKGPPGKREIVRAHKKSPEN